MQVASFGCAAVADVEPQALGLTYWFDAPNEGEARSVSIRFSGRRIGVKRKPGRRDSFSVVETVERVVPGSGPIAVTARVSDVAPGEWHVTAAPTSEPRRHAPGRASGADARWPLPSASSSGTTGYAPIIRIRAPGARLGAWPCLVGVGVVVALSTQAVVARHTGLPPMRVLALSLVASVVGLVGAKLYYLVEHRGRPQNVVTAGMCIQGFVLGAIGALVAGAVLADVPVGRVLDVTTPGLLFGMTIGRYGCFFGGCCAGRPTGSRWGLWSSDRRLGVRRIPTQLIESTIALAIGLVALLVVWSTTTRPAGTVFIAAIAAYTLGRQLLFPLRDLPRHTDHGRTLTMGIAAIAIAVDVAVAVFG